MEIFATGNIPGLQSTALTYGLAPADIVITPALVDYSELLRVRDEIVANRASLDSLGITLSSVGPDDARDSVRVGVASDVSTAQEYFRAKYGNKTYVESQGLMKEDASRLNDVAPWNGGDFTITPKYNYDSYCSTGPPVIRTSTGANYLLTDGHCYVDPSTAVNSLTGFIYKTLNGWQVAGASGRPTIGYAAAEYQAAGYDVALIFTGGYGNSSRANYRTGPANLQASPANQISAQGSVVGASVCASGAYSGERCGAIVRYVNQDTLTFANFVRYNEVGARNPGIAIEGQGDSGGPVYQVHATGLVMTGLITGHPDVDPIGTTNGLPCPQNDQGQRGAICTDSVWYHDLVSVMNHLGVALKTS